MNHYWIPMMAAIGCALCNGVAAVLQKISADKEKRATKLEASLMWRLFQDVPFVGGVVLDLLGWALTLYAVQSLPLFLVEAIIAANIIVTLIVERVFRRQRMARGSYRAIGVIFLGLLALSFVASPEKAQPVTNLVRWLIILMPIPLGLAGYFIAQLRAYWATIALAVLAGLAFGDTSVIGRIFKVSQPIRHTIYSPLIFGLIASGILGITLFSTALQRVQATIANATMTASQTVIPSIIGIVFLGDDARNGLWYLVAIGIMLALSGVYMLTAWYPGLDSNQRP